MSGMRYRVRAEGQSDGCLPARSVRPFTWPRKLRALVLMLPLLLGLAACSPEMTRSEGPSPSDRVALAAPAALGQTFTPRYDGLTSVRVYLAKTTQPPARLTLRLLSSPQDASALRQVTLSAQELEQAVLAAPGYLKFQFAPLPASRNQDYYFELSSSGGEISLGSAPAESYLNGAMYLDGLAQEGQLAFRLGYENKALLSGLALEVLGWAPLLIAAWLLLVLPGWVLCAWGYPGWDELRWPAKIGLAGALGAAIYPLLFLAAWLLRLRAGALLAWLPVGLGLAAWLWLQRRSLQAWAKQSWPRPALGDWQAPELAYLLVMGLVIFSRLWAIRSLDAPMWGDSYQHTMITQLLIDHQGLFRSWEPYTPLQTFTYHFGFHTLSAAYHWLTGLDAARSVLWIGQLLNILAVAGLYPLAQRVFPNRWSGTLAVLVAGLLIPMPMYYLNWGRYTQLSGQVILTLVILLSWDWFSRAQISWRQQVLGCLALAGLALAHFRILFFALAFLLAGSIFYLRRANAPQVVRRVLLSGAGAGLFFLPWFINVYGGKILGLFARVASPAAAPSAEAPQQIFWRADLALALPPWAWYCLAGAALWALLSRQRQALLFTGWCLLTWLMGNPQFFGLPGAGIIGNFTVAIAAYFPAGVLLGGSAGQMLEILAKLPEQRVSTLQPRWPRLWDLALIVLVVAAAGWGVRLRLRDIHPEQGILLTRPDLRAISWVDTNLPADARIVVNSFLAFEGDSAVGSDGGWWIPLLSGRQTNLPPINYAFEAGPSPDFQAWTNELTRVLQDNQVTSPAALSMLRQRGYTYLYIGQRQGSVNYAGPGRFEPAALAASPDFEMLYHQDRVWIFKIR